MSNEYGEATFNLLANALGKGGGGSNDALLMSMLNSNGGLGGGNNILTIILLLFLFNKNGLGNSADGAVVNDMAITGQIDSAINKAAATQSFNTTILDAVKGNAAAISQLAQTLNCDVNQIQMAICDIKASLAGLSQKYDCGVDKILGVIGTNGQQIINAIQSGNCSVMQAIERCCCENKQALNQVYNDLTMQNVNNSQRIVDTVNNRSNITDEKINALALQMERGFNNLELQRANDKNEILSQRVNTLERQAETASIIAALKKEMCGNS